MILFTAAEIKDIPVIQRIAQETWPHTFGKVMPAEQIDYMLSLAYSTRSLEQQILEKNHRFILVYKDNQALGYSSYETNYKGEPKLMIHKAYLLPATQGMGIGTKLFDELSATARRHNNFSLRLKVFFENFNAIRFYEKYGFHKTGIEKTDIGNNYIILDDVMEKQLTQ